MPDDETTLFRQSWTLYDALSAKNYMFHREIYDCVAAILKERHDRGFECLLDLGCGNARFLAPCLLGSPPDRYEGVDLSAAALDEARDYLKGLAQFTLHQADMLEAVETRTEKVDVIFTGYAVHHLSFEAKQRLFHACARVLKPDGLFLMVDVVREEGQSREAYLEGYLGTMRTQWTEVQPAHLDEACAHVAAFDFPETLSDLTQMAKDAGLSKTSLMQRHVQHHLLAFRA
jgi:SAM-dependent methyltransferase